MLPLEHFLELATHYSVIPLKNSLGSFEWFQLDLFKLSQDYPYSLLLESGEHGKERGRFTYFADQPFLVIQVEDNQVKIEADPDEFQQLKTNGLYEKIIDNPVSGIENISKRYRSPRILGYPPFTGGGIGYFSYEFIKRLERIENANQKPSLFSEIHLAFVKELLVYDHAEKELQLFYNVMIETEDTEEQKKDKYLRAIEYLKQRAQFWQERIEQCLQKPIPLHDLPEIRKNFEQPFLPDQFMAAVETIKKNILKGEIFQAVLSQKLITKTKVHPAIVYQVLRQINPSPYMFYLQMNHETIVGASPETLVKVFNEEISTFPIAGTRPRGKTEQEDLALEQELLADEKERAEHVMLIDLARNDIGKVSKPGSVIVAEKMKIERYSHVMHIVSKVIGQQKEEKSAFDVLKAVFPAGTVSGAPKVRAMELIAELEPIERGPYAGAVAALAFNGNLDTCITIRSIFFKEETAYVQAGAGIVADSVPLNEYMESMNKAKAMLKAIEISESLS
ncbi:chorismate-binding protein [Tepidibacillus infernus]|uniref:anthranilate synthase component I family protein n=1 Tax=Tepidibacillus TaxID=1494427 RepID=UPI0008394B04|nr:chorismate-binding protein [Tepidibacillus decaturensis]